MPVITSTTTTVAPSARCQAISDLFQSIALQQAALSHILNAEGEKIQKVVAMEDVTAEILLETNKSVEAMVNSISNLEMILKDKIDLFKECSCDCKKLK